MSSTRRRNGASIACTCEPEVFEPGLIRGAAVKYNDSRALRLRRRALLKWQPGSPSKVLIVKKPKNPAASAKLHEIGTWLKARGLQVFVERIVWATEFKELEVFDPHVNRDGIDFCITLGGDGTVLYMTSLFEEDEPLPPTLCFAMGSLGFLTPFDAASAVPTLERVLDTSTQPLFCTLRTRKRCEVVYDGRLEAVHHVLNECVVDRGAFPGAVLMEIFADGSYVTNVEADGLIISTPSGSTAYSMSAGGPIVAPSVPCTVITPLAPLSLSFRPLVIPESSALCVHLPTCARAHARASFDGRRPMRIRRGTSVFFTASLCPLPVISLGRMDTDWYEGITSKLKWNQAIRQLPSCPSPVAARQTELRSRVSPGSGTAAVCAMLDTAAEGCPVASAPAAAAPAKEVEAAAAAVGLQGISRASGVFGSAEDCGSAASGSEAACADACAGGSRESFELYGGDGGDADADGDADGDGDAEADGEAELEAEYDACDAVGGCASGSSGGGAGAYCDGGWDGAEEDGSSAAEPSTPRPAADADAAATATAAAAAAVEPPDQLECEVRGLVLERAGSLAKAAEAAVASAAAKARAHAEAALRRPAEGAGADAGGSAAGGGEGNSSGNGSGGSNGGGLDVEEAAALVGRTRSLR